MLFSCERLEQWNTTISHAKHLWCVTNSEINFLLCVLYQILSCCAACFQKLSIFIDAILCVEEIRGLSVNYGLHAVPPKTNFVLCIVNLKWRTTRADILRRRVLFCLNGNRRNARWKRQYKLQNLKHFLFMYHVIFFSFMKSFLELNWVVNINLKIPVSFENKSTTKIITNKMIKLFNDNTVYFNVKCYIG